MITPLCLLDFMLLLGAENSMHFLLPVRPGESAARQRGKLEFTSSAAELSVHKVNNFVPRVI